MARQNCRMMAGARAMQNRKKSREKLTIVSRSAAPRSFGLLRSASKKWAIRASAFMELAAGDLAADTPTLLSPPPSPPPPFGSPSLGVTAADTAALLPRRDPVYALAPTLGFTVFVLTIPGSAFVTARRILEGSDCRIICMRNLILWRSTRRRPLWCNDTKRHKIVERGEETMS